MTASMISELPEVREDRRNCQGFSKNDVSFFFIDDLCTS